MSHLTVGLTEPPKLSVVVVEDRVDVVVGGTPGAATVEIRVPGPAGPPGPKGDPGDIASGSGDLSYVHVQSVLSSKWRMPHGLGRRPNGTFFDTAGSQWYPDVSHESTEVMLADFGSVEVAGIANLT